MRTFTILALGALLSASAFADGSTIWSGAYSCAPAGRPAVQVEVRELDGGVAFLKISFVNGNFQEGVSQRAYDAATGSTTLTLGLQQTQAMRFSSSGEPSLLAGGVATSCSKR